MEHVLRDDPHAPVLVPLLLLLLLPLEEVVELVYELRPHPGDGPHSPGAAQPEHRQRVEVLEHLEEPADVPGDGPTRGDLLRLLGEAPGVDQDDVPQPVGVLQGVGGGKVPTEAVSEEAHAFKADLLPPPLQRRHELLLRLLVLGAEVRAGAAGEAGQVQGVDGPPHSVLVAPDQAGEVEAEEGDAGGHPVQHHQWKLLLLMLLLVVEGL